MTETYTPKHFLEEIRGLADGSGVNYDTLYQINLFPEVMCAKWVAWEASSLF